MERSVTIYYIEQRKIFNQLVKQVLKAYMEEHVETRYQETDWFFVDTFPREESIDVKIDETLVGKVLLDIEIQPSTGDSVASFYFVPAKRFETAFFGLGFYDQNTKRGFYKELIEIIPNKE